MNETRRDETGREMQEILEPPREPHALALREAKVRRKFWPKVRANLARVPFMDKAIGAYYATLDSRTPLGAKATLLGALAYFILPTDMIPDFVAGLGYGDDLAVLLAALRATKGYVRDEHMERARVVLTRLAAGEDPAEGDGRDTEIEAGSPAFGPTHEDAAGRGD